MKNLKRINTVCAVLLGFSIAACISRQKPASQRISRSFFQARNPAAEYSGGYKYSNFFDTAPDANVTCKEFFALLKNAKPKPSTILQALEILKEKKAKYFTHYVLLPRSLSLHESSYSDPRAMVYGGDGKMVLTFNGKSTQGGYERLEVMCFNEQLSKFEFREVTFPSEATGELADLTKSQRRQPYVISKLNSSGTHDCRQCHGNPTRPNWDSYADWPSSFGSDDDILFQKNFFNPPSDDMILSIKYNEAEVAAFKQFTKTGRYAVLAENATDRPNLTAGKIFAILNAKRIVAELKRLGPAFERVKSSFSQALYCPEPVEKKSFVNSEGKGIITKNFITPLDPNLKRIADQSAGYFMVKAARMRDNYNLDRGGDYQSQGEITQVAGEYYQSLGFDPQVASYVLHVDVEALQRLSRIEKLVQPLGLDLENWSLVPKGGYEYEDGSGGDLGVSFAQQMDKPYLDTFYADDPELISLVERRRTMNGNYNSLNDGTQKREQAICEHLKSRELK